MTLVHVEMTLKSCGSITPPPAGANDFGMVVVMVTITDLKVKKNV